MMLLFGSCSFLIGCLIAIARNFFHLGLDESKGMIEESGFLIVGLLTIPIPGLMLGHYMAAVGCFLTAVLNCLVFYDMQYWPSSGVLKKHEIDHILSRQKDFEIGEDSLEHYEVKEEQGVCKIYDHGVELSTQEGAEFAITPPNADDYGLFEQFRIGRWKYRSENWLRHRSLLYDLYRSFMERTGS